MNMIKKIALTASILLFVLAQIFSFYVIYISHQEKIGLLQEKEGKFFSEAVRRGLIELQSVDKEIGGKDYVITFCFRKNLMQNTALYKGTVEMFNNSPYEFDVNHTDWEKQGYPMASVTEKINGRHLLIFYLQEELTETDRDQNGKDMYHFYYALDITSFYEKSFSLIVKELILSFFSSVGMAVLLTYLIKKITKPLQAVNETQRQLIGSMSHELKTPIALIQGYAEGLKECINEDEASREFYCEVIMDEADKMNKLVKNLLTLNQLESGSEHVVFERFDLMEVVSGVVNATAILREQNGIQLEIYGQKPVYVWADEFKTEQVMMNYISNAIHYAAGEKRIEVSVVPGPETVRVEVFNTGNPIPETELVHVWEKFYKVDKARTREYGGNGIGLSIVKAIMDSFHRECGVCNEYNGVKFWFELDSRSQ